MQEVRLVRIPTKKCVPPPYTFHACTLLRWYSANQKNHPKYSLPENMTNWWCLRQNVTFQVRAWVLLCPVATKIILAIFWNDEQFAGPSPTRSPNSSFITRKGSGEKTRDSGVFGMNSPRSSNKSGNHTGHFPRRDGSQGDTNVFVVLSLAIIFIAKYF